MKNYLDPIYKHAISGVDKRTAHHVPPTTYQRFDKIVKID